MYRQKWSWAYYLCLIKFGFLILTIWSLGSLANTLHLTIIIPTYINVKILELSNHIVHIGRVRQRVWNIEVCVINYVWLWVLNLFNRSTRVNTAEQGTNIKYLCWMINEIWQWVLNNYIDNHILIIIMSGGCHSTRP